jgi:hypothetical protein
VEYAGELIDARYSVDTVHRQNDNKILVGTVLYVQYVLMWVFVVWNNPPYQTKQDIKKLF